MKSYEIDEKYMFFESRFFYMVYSANTYMLFYKQSPFLYSTTIAYFFLKLLGGLQFRLR
jgi:hypothetical protein